MAAPAAVARDVPFGRHLYDGYQTFVGFQLAPRVALWEKAVTPPGCDGGDPIDQTTMWTLTWRQQTPRHLKQLTEVTFTAGYDTLDLDTIIGMINIIQSINVFYPDGTVMLFWGFLRKFEVNEHKEGEQPDAVCTIAPSMIDPIAPGGSLRPVSESPLLAFVSGSGFINPQVDMRDIRSNTSGVPAQVNTTSPVVIRTPPPEAQVESPEDHEAADARRRRPRPAPEPEDDGEDDDK